MQATEMHARLLVTSHGRNRQHVQFELAATTRKKQWMCVVHTYWTWAHQETSRPGIQILVQLKQFGLFKQKHTPSQLVCVSNIC